MPRLVDEAIDAIGNADPELAAEGVRVAALFFEYALGQTQVLDRKEVATEPASQADLARIRMSLEQLVRQEAASPVTGAAVFALGKLHDPALAGFFVEVLRRHLHGDAGVLYQAMIALDNLGAEVFGGRNSMSVLEEVENRAMAAGYLQRLGADSGETAAPGRPGPKT